MPPMTPEKQEVEKAFKCFDTDNDGYLTKVRGPPSLLCSPCPPCLPFSHIQLTTVRAALHLYIAG